jgi:ribosomal protein L40E
VDFSKIVSDILARELECPRCKFRNAPMATRCSRCATSLRADEPSLSVLSKEQKRVNPAIVNLEEASNFILLRRAASGLADGTITVNDYRFIVHKLRGIGRTGIDLLDSDMMVKKFQDAPVQEIVLRDEMYAAFVQLEQGMVRMEKFLSSGDWDDVREGAAMAEAAYEVIDRIERESDEL